MNQREREHEEDDVSDSVLGRIVIDYEPSPDSIAFAPGSRPGLSPVERESGERERERWACARPSGGGAK